MEDAVRGVVVGPDAAATSCAPTGRQAKVTWVKSPPGTATPTSARPVTIARLAGAEKTGAGTIAVGAELGVGPVDDGRQAAGR